MDTINSPIRYSFVSGVPGNFEEYFRIDPDTGAVHQIKAVDTSTTKKFTIIIKVKEQFTYKHLFLSYKKVLLFTINILIKTIRNDQHFQAQEISEAKRSTTAKLFITVKPVDAHPPELILSSREGFVFENSPIGEKIVDINGNPITVRVEDKDFVSTKSFFAKFYITKSQIIEIFK